MEVEREAARGEIWKGKGKTVTSRCSYGCIARKGETSKCGTRGRCVKCWLTAGGTVRLRGRGKYAGGGDLQAATHLIWKHCITRTSQSTQSRALPCTLELLG